MRGWKPPPPPWVEPDALPVPTVIVVNLPRPEVHPTPVVADLMVHCHCHHGREPSAASANSYQILHPASALLPMGPGLRPSMACRWVPSWWRGDRSKFVGGHRLPRIIDRIAYSHQIAKDVSDAAPDEPIKDSAPGRLEQQRRGSTRRATSKAFPGWGRDRQAVEVVEARTA